MFAELEWEMQFTVFNHWRYRWTDWILHSFGIRISLKNNDENCNQSFLNSNIHIKTIKQESGLKGY